MDVHTCAKVVGVIIVFIGVGGLVLGEQSLLGRPQHRHRRGHRAPGHRRLDGRGGLPRSDSAVRSVAGGLGIVYLVVGVLGIGFGFFVGRRSDSRLAH